MIDKLPTIYNGHDPGGCFWILPVKCHSTERVGWESVEECKSAEISLDELDVDGLLAYFFKKHFDKTLLYNQQRYDDAGGIKGICFPAAFEWNLTYNFYSYDAIRAMLNDIRLIMDALGSTGLDAVPQELSKDIKNWFFTFCDPSLDQAAAESLAYSNPSCVIDYYRQFIRCMDEMMDSYPNWPLISIMGP